jgi:hypothetical protein
MIAGKHKASSKGEEKKTTPVTYFHTQFPQLYQQKKMGCFFPLKAIERGPRDGFSNVCKHKSTIQ